MKRVKVLTGKYDVILADPPWSYDVWTGKGKGEKVRTADSHYNIMSIEELIAMGPMVRRLSNKNCAMFLWMTPPTIEENFILINEWGFKYKTFAFVWVKVTPFGKPHISPGHYTRSNTEPCLLGIKGSMPVVHKGISQVILAPRRKHSQKPVETYRKIELLYPDARKLELFARNNRPGWDVWGDEI